jgi:hypothetical protein
MNIDLRDRVTAEQKQIIMEAIADEPGSFAAWARGVLPRAPRERMKTKRKKAPC